jgi:predicted DsbA family dithiol-disulfide isomerase
MKWPEIWGQILPRRILLYADFIDPFCYVGFHNVRRAAETKKIPLEWRGFELNPATPPEGALLQAAVNSDLRQGMWASVESFAKKSGLALSEPSQVPNTRLAHLWVGTIPKPDVKNSLIERIYQAYLSDKKDIGDPHVLAALAGDWGLPKERVYEFAAKRDASRLEQFRQQAINRGFPGMPGFLYQGKTYFGALSEDAWIKIL